MASSALPARVSDIESDNNFSPIGGLATAPVLSIADAVREAQKDPDLRGRNFGVNVSTAGIFARFASSTPGHNPHGLSQDELACIQLYTQETDIQRILNIRLKDRDRAKLVPFLPLVRLFLSGLYKLPPRAATLYRGKREDMRAQFPKGQEKIWWTFSSTTVSLDVLQSDRFLGNSGPRTQFIIEACHAYDIQMYSAYPGEAELILPPHTVLRVVSVLDAGHGLVQVQMRQEPYEMLELSLGGGESVDAVAASARSLSLSHDPTAFDEADMHAVIAAMVAHRDNIDVQKKGCRALCNIAAHADNQLAVAHAGGIEAVVAAMKAHPGSVDVQHWGCRALVDIAVHADNQLAVARAGGIAAVVVAMKAHPGSVDVQHWGCRALASIAAHADNQVAVARAGGITAVVAAMKAHRGSVDVQHYGCWALCNIAGHADNKLPVAHAGGIAAVVAAMKAHPGSVDVQLYGCRALVNITVHADNQVAVARAGGIAAVVAAMGAHPGSVDVQENGCGALAIIAIDADNQVAVARAGGITAVVAAMKAHPGSVDVQHYGCFALVSIAIHAENQLFVARAGGIEAVVAAMKAHPGSVDVQHYGCRALVNISHHADNELPVARAGGIAAVVAAMKAHPGSVDVQYWGCLALMNIAWTAIECRQRVVVAGGAELVCRALASHPTHEKLQEEGRQLMKKLFG